MPEHAFQTENYTTPTNHLPVVVTGVGEYITRNGLRVTVHEIKYVMGEYNPAYTEFAVKGSVHRKTKSGKTRYDYNIWHISGRTDTFKEVGLDIVAKA